MRSSGRHRDALPRGGWRRILAALALVAACLTGSHALARDATIRGTAAPGYGRIAIEFDQPTKVQVRVTNSVLVIGFANSARIRQERLATELPGYISAVRRDPDETGLRIALVGPFKPSVLEAGERIFVDLLPPNWSGLPPGLPPEVVAQLAARAIAAEAKLSRQQQERPHPEPPRPVRLQVAILPTLTRLVFEPPPGTPMRISGAGDNVELAFDGPTALDLAGEKPRLALGVQEFMARSGSASLAVRIGATPGFEARAVQDDGTIVVDLARARRASATEADHPATADVPPVEAKITGRSDVATAMPASLELHDQPAAHALPPGAGSTKPAGPHSAEAKPPAAKLDSAKPDPGKPDFSKPDLAKPGMAKPDPAKAAAAKPDVTQAGLGQTGQARTDPPESETREVAGRTPAELRPTGSGTVKAVVQQRDGSSSILFPFATVPAAAAFERSGRVTLVFDTGEHIVLPPGLAPSGDPSQTGESGISVIRLNVPDRQPLRFAVEEAGWRLVMGGRDALPPDPVKVIRSTDGSSSGVLKIDLREAAAAHWITGEDGERLVVVTARGRSQGVPKAMNFVEFGLPPTLQGVAVQSRADDLSVSLSGSGVTISRERGLWLSSAADAGAGAAKGPGVILPRSAWQQDRSGDVLARASELVAVVASAPRSGRAEVRSREARLLLANGMNEEAAGLLALARAEDPVFARRRETSLLAGIANVRAGRLAQARSLLNAEGLADDAEAVLWRAVLDAGERRWGAALKGIARSGAVLDQYGDELAGPVHLAALNAALELGDLARAETELGIVDRLPSEAVDHDEHEFARAWFDEASGRTDVARKAYAALIADAGQRIWARASLRAIRLAVREGKMPDEEAIERLELLAVAWRGDDVELGAMVDLSHLYAHAHRWRDVFNEMRLASQLFPAAEMTRTLQEETARFFEAVMLAGPDSSLSPVDALALYFDFKELAPLGRRGDEIVRRLSDRLVELDLLDQAADLLQYQVDNRLAGAARASIAARLAAIRLMNAKPAEALAALHGSRLANLPEDLRQFRLLLEAQALAELQRVDLALEAVEGEPTPEFARLKAGILWNARRWRAAGEAFEALVGRRWQEPGPFSDRERGDVLRAAVAYGFAGEALGQGRLRSKFSARMSDSPDAATFDMLLKPDAAETRAFRAAALGLSKGDAIKMLLDEWRANHSGMASEAAAPSVHDARTEPKPGASTTAVGQVTGTTASTPL